MVARKFLSSINGVIALTRSSTIRKFRIVQKEYGREVESDVP